MFQTWFLLGIMLLSTANYAQSVDKNNSSSLIFIEKLQTFSEASEFFYETLAKNFHGNNNGENLYSLMQMVYKTVDNEDMFRLQIDSKKFEVLNESLQLVYDDFFPVHTYTYQNDTEIKHTVDKTVISKVRDTIEITIPLEMGCLRIINTAYEGNFKYSFHQQLVTQELPSIIQADLIQFLDGTGLYSARELSIRCFRKYSAKELEAIFKNEYDSILVSLVFWEYLADCANYDLNTRKYFYEE